MPFAILRFQKKKEGGIAHCERHNERKKAAYKSNPDIDIELSAQNYHLAGPPRYTYKREVNQKIKEAGCRVRKDSIRMVETLITASPELMNAFDEQERHEYFERALEFMQEKVGTGNIISAVVHMDEKTPHMHLVFCPITEDGRLSAKQIIGNQKKLSEWQTAFHEFMSERWPELERGRSAIETHRKHIPTWLFKMGDNLDRECAEIIREMGEINFMNAGKKREILTEKLARLIPEIDRFRSEVNKTSEHIDYLSDQLRLTDNAYRNIRGELYDEKKANGEDKAVIRKLENQLRTQEKLLKKIPPEIIAEIQKREREKNERNASR